VVIPALVKALKSGHLAGAAVDVYPHEPASNGQGFESDLRGCPNSILTPHIGSCALYILCFFCCLFSVSHIQVMFDWELLAFF